MRQQLTVPIGQIRENAIALRGVNKESEDYIGLRDSIRQLGILNPINVRPSAEVPGTYELVDGLHRFTAAKDAGLTELPVHVLDINEAQVLIAQVMANVHKVETKPVEYTKQLIRILGQNPTWTATELAVKLGKSPTWISERLGLVKLHPDIAKLVDDGKINVSNAYPLAKLPAIEQVNYVDAAMQMPPTEFTPTIQARLKEIRDASRQGRAAAPAEFVPVEHLRKISEIKDAKIDPSNILALAESQKAKKPEDVIKLTLSWILNVDPVSAQQQKDRHEQRKKEQESAKEARKAERDAKKAQDAATAVANLQPA